MDASLPRHPWAWVYYVSFVVRRFVAIDLFIVIVINNLEAAKREQHTSAGPEKGALAARLGDIRERLGAIEEELRASQGPQ